MLIWFTLASTLTWLLTSAASPESYFGGQDNDAYLSWASTLEYDGTTFLSSAADADRGAALHWRIVDDQYLELGVAAHASGWLGFGLTVNGGMTGSDMVLVEAQDPTVAKDAYVQENRHPVEDDCQDWQLLNATLDSNFFMVELRRKLETGDLQDLPIRNDSDVSIPVSRVIAAWGDDDVVSYHGPNNARGALRWFGSGSEEDLFQALMDTQADNHFLLAAQQHAIPTINTTEYAHFCFSESDLQGMGVEMSEGAAMIGFSPLIDNTRHVHHLILQAYFTDGENITSCTQEAKGLGDITYIWAPGEPSFAFPDNVAFELGGTSGYRSFMLEIHYDNAARAESQVDSSGVRVYYSLEPREHTAGFYIVGDPTVALIGHDIPSGTADYTFECPGTCTSSVVAPDEEPITVMREYLHMHQSGSSISFEQRRQSELVRRSAVDYFDFAQTGGPSPQQDPYKILPGDSFQIQCSYQNSGSSRKFGFGSSEEMCMAFLLYYPRKSMSLGGAEVSWMCGVGFADMGLGDCQTNWTSRVLTDGQGPNGRVFGTPSETCTAQEAVGGSTTSGAQLGFAVARSAALFILALAAQQV